MTLRILIAMLAFGLFGSMNRTTLYALLRQASADSIGQLPSTDHQVKEKIATLRLQAQKNPASPTAHLELGIALSDAELWDEARSEFRIVLKLRPHDATALYNLGLTDLRAAQSVESGPSSAYYQWLDSAQKLLLQAAQLDPALPGLHRHLGDLYRRVGDQESAIEEFRKAVIADPDSPVEYNNLGSALADVERYEAAVREYKKAFALDPASASVLMNLVGAVRRAGKVKDLLQESQAELQQNPSSIPAQLLYGVALYWDGDKNGALRELNLVLSKEPKFSAVHFYKGEVLREKGNMAEAEAEYAQAASLAPDRTDFTVRYATTLMEQGKLRESETLLKRVLQSRPNDAALHFQLGRILQKLNQKAAATDEFAKSTRLKQKAYLQGQIAMHLLEGIRQLRENRISEAVEQFQEARAADPDRPEANFYLGIALSQMGDIVNSKRAFEAAIQQRPSSAEIHYNFGIALWQHQQSSEAIDEFRKAIYLRSDYGLAHCALGLALAHMGFPEEAKKEIERSRELGACGAQGTSSSGVTPQD